MLNRVQSLMKISAELIKHWFGRLRTHIVHDMSTLLGDRKEVLHLEIKKEKNNKQFILNETEKTNISGTTTRNTCIKRLDEVMFKNVI